MTLQQRIGCFSVVLRPGQHQFALIEEIVAGIAHFLEKFGIKFETGTEFVLSHWNGVPNGKGPGSIELQSQIDEGILSVFDRLAAHFIDFHGTIPRE